MSNVYMGVRRGREKGGGRRRGGGGEREREREGRRERGVDLSCMHMDMCVCVLVNMCTPLRDLKMFVEEERMITMVNFVRDS